MPLIHDSVVWPWSLALVIRDNLRYAYEHWHPSFDGFAPSVVELEECLGSMSFRFGFVFEEGSLVRLIPPGCPPRNQSGPNLKFSENRRQSRWLLTLCWRRTHLIRTSGL